MKHGDMDKAKGKAKPKADDAPLQEAFDLWLTRGLHRLYDTVAKEPIPADLLKLIEDDREK